MPVSDSHPGYDSHIGLWRKCRDVTAGQEAVHRRGELYLPRLDGQAEADYGAYRGRALFFNATQRTLDGMLGLIFRKPPRLESPPPLAGLASDIDLMGSGLIRFAEALVEELLTVGRAGVLADHPPARPELVTAGQARAAKQRPFLRRYRAEDILDWREGPAGNATALTHLRLFEMASLAHPGDEFRSLEVEQIRVLDLDGEGLYRQRVFRFLEGVWCQQGPDILPLMGGRRMTFIPFIFFGPKDNRAAPAKPPLLDLVNLNLSHYRTAADFEHGAHFTGLPTPVVTGHRLDEEAVLAIGAGEAWVLPAADAKAFFLEFSGQGLGALERSLERKEAQMAAIGARMLAPEKRAVEAAATLAIRRSGENSVLATLAQSAAQGLARALKILRDWSGAQGPVAFELNRDYLPLAMSAEQLQAHVAAWQAGALSDESLFEALKQGEVIAESLSFEEERSRKQS